MEDLKTTQRNVDEQFAPPKLSRASTILNGVSNGAMIGVLPIAVWEWATKFKDKSSSRAALYGTAFATVLGCTVGAIHGRSEAREVERYRISVTNELERARNEVTRLHDKIDAMEATASVRR